MLQPPLCLLLLASPEEGGLLLLLQVQRSWSAQLWWSWRTRVHWSIIQWSWRTRLWWTKFWWSWRSQVRWTWRTLLQGSLSSLSWPWRPSLSSPPSFPVCPVTVKEAALSLYIATVMCVWGSSLLGALAPDSPELPIFPVCLPSWPCPISLHRPGPQPRLQTHQSLAGPSLRLRPGPVPGLQTHRRPPGLSLQLHPGPRTPDPPDHPWLNLLSSLAPCLPSSLSPSLPAFLVSVI